MAIFEQMACDVWCLCLSGYDEGRRSLAGKSVTARIRIHSLIADKCLVLRVVDPANEAKWCQECERHINVAKTLGREVEAKLAGLDEMIF